MNVPQHGPHFGRPGDPAATAVLGAPSTPGVPGYEYQLLTFRREASRAEIRRAVAEAAEYGHWELVRSVVYVGGVRRMWMRRKVIRVQRTA